MKSTNKKLTQKVLIPALGISLILSLGACGTMKTETNPTTETIVTTVTDETDDTIITDITDETEEITVIEETESVSESTETETENSENEYFTNRDLSGEYDESEAIRIHFDGTTGLVTSENESISEDLTSYVTLSSDSATITKEGIYILSGDYEGTIIVSVDKSEKVQLVLNNLSIENTDTAGIYVEQADKVFVTLAEGSTNKITVSDAFAETEEGIDGAIYSKEDLVINGNGSLEIISSTHGVVSKDDLKITGGNITITSGSSGLRANDSICLTTATVDITSGTDGLHVENSEDENFGYIYILDGFYTINADGDGMSASKTILIEGGEFNITSGGGSTGQTNTASFGIGGRFGQMNANWVTTGEDEESTKGIKADDGIVINNGEIEVNSLDDGIHTNSDLTINNGDITVTSDDDALHADGKLEINGDTINVTGAEGIEATYVLINDGDISISASDDGINAGSKSNAYDVAIEINGGNVEVNMGQGDTDGIDSNGNIYINGGTISVNAQSPFDYDGRAEYNGGTIIVNGQQTDSITNQMMGGGMFGGDMGGRR